MCVFEILKELNPDISKCVNNEGSYSCQCFESFEQIDSLTCGDLTEDNPCAKANACDHIPNSICVNHPNELVPYSCQCRDGFDYDAEDVTCTEDIFEEFEVSNVESVSVMIITCQNNPCLNGGLCDNETGTQQYQCNCAQGYSGVHCESKSAEKFPITTCRKRNSLILLTVK